MTTTTTAIPTLKAAALLPLLALTACAGSQRFSGPVMNPPSYNQPALPAAPPVASAPVTSEPLPPPGGYPAASAPAPGAPGQDPFFESGGVPPGQGQPPMEQPGSGPAAPGNNQIAGLGPSPTTPARPSATRDNVIGGWTAREATGGTCRVQLSSAPTLDLYRASSSGCANRDLQKITAWDYRDGEVYLYQQGGTVAARLRATSGNALDGAVTKSGAALSLNR
ncbi:AprI/Inh family metalloprotease inhibitor [Bosea sp. (in: a-proteobacteria)]|uniref:AprI/Inh family metalloprotease inhibitor n=1 Tax=Bosea sp. (in: a-proteobacteria) TaxID=1871050 RepID=UPI0033424364